MRTILPAGRRTAFRYRIEGGMDNRDREEIEAMDPGYVLWHEGPAPSDSIDLRHRIHYMKKRNLGFRLIGARDPDFAHELETVDPLLPSALGSAVADLYLNGTLLLSDHAENIEAATPRGARERGWCQEMFRALAENYGGNYERTFLRTAPVLFEGNFDISGSRRNGFFTELTFILESEDRPFTV